MWQLIVGFVVVIAVLAFVLNRRGNSGLHSKGSTDTEAGSLGQAMRHNHPGSGGIGAP
ncbi:hypothetical protein [Knoellia sp. LjRoot47]|uniref:hypothetical protein n=1 Tax=Knoellia sp. LjRoot47 TaxID=3342330 RepID=UPI003ECF21BC